MTTMKRATFAGILCFVLCLLLASIPALAQTATTGQITGTVKDPTGAVIAGAKLNLASTAGEQRETTSDAEGFFRFPLLPPGGYTLKVSAPGFKVATFDNVMVKITQTTELSPEVALAGATEQISVSAEAPLVNAANSTTGRVIEDTQVRQLPLPTRNFQQLLALSPGTSANLSNNTELGRGDVNIDVNGQRATSNNVVVDGMEVNSPGTNSTPNLSVPAPDAIQEFIVQTSMYDASQGRNSGGNVAVVTKSGTDSFHGSVYEFFRNRVLNANDYFLNKAGVERPVLNRNQFGGTFGGPIIKDKTFFFVSYQGTRERNGASLSNSLSFPQIPAGLTDDRSAAAITSTFGLPVNPITLQLLQAKLPNGNYVIPSAAPNSELTGTLVSSPQSGVSRFREDQFNTNIDQMIGQKNRLSGKFFFSNTPQTQAIWNFIGSNAYQLQGFGGDIEFFNRVLTISDTHTFSPRLLNQARFGYSRIDGPGSPNEPFKNSDFGITNPLCAGNPQFCGLSTIYVANMFTLGNYPLSDQRSTTQTYEFSDMISYTLGRHNLRFGGDYRRYLVDFFFNFYSRGYIQFGSFQNFLLGVPDFGLLGNGVRDRNYRASDLDLFL
jgi:Carboxypeptidase regulatory-like domain/TonB-dependent Receptor Plug Domain